MDRYNKNISRIMETLLAKCKFELLNVLFSLNLNEILDLNDNTKLNDIKSTVTFTTCFIHVFSLF